MKKAIAILILLITFFTTAYAEVDYSTLSTDELTRQYDAIRNELFERVLVADGKTVLFDQDNVSVYLTGKYEISKNWKDELILKLEAVVINNYNTVVNVTMKNSNASINGWDVYAEGITSTNSGKKQKGYFELNMTDADITTFEEIEDIEFQFYLYDFDNWKTISYIEPVRVFFNK